MAPPPGQRYKSPRTKRPVPQAQFRKYQFQISYFNSNLKMSLPKKKKDTYEEEERAKHCCCILFRSLPNDRLRYCPLLVPAFYTWSLVVASTSPEGLFLFPIHVVYKKKHIVNSEYRANNGGRAIAKQGRNNEDAKRSLHNNKLPRHLIIVNFHAAIDIPIGKNEEILLTITFFICNPIKLHIHRGGLWAWYHWFRSKMAK